ncbi:MAG: divergent polysaccharide deacetylase family protein [Hyphomonadaceae bacterium]
MIALAGASAAAIQVFGDPAAGGPHRTIALAPSPASAEAAPRISFSDAAQAGAELAPEPDLFADATPPELDSGDPYAPAAAPGQVRVAVLDNSAQQAATAVRPLPRAPFAGMTQHGPLGPLPVIASDGRRAAQAYARPFTGDSSKPKIAIIVGGLGFNQRTTAQAINELPPEVTLSFVPYATDLQTWINRARAGGHEVMLELPMEPFDSQADDTGPQTLLASAAAAQNTARLENLLSRGAGYFGVTNYQGARFAASAQASAPVAQQLNRRGLAFIATGIGQRTALSVEAARAGLPNTAADRIIDARREADAIDEQLLNLEALALQNGSAIGAGFAYPVTMVQVAHWAAEIRQRGYALAPASAVLAERAQRR